MAPPYEVTKPRASSNVSALASGDRFEARGGQQLLDRCRLAKQRMQRDQASASDSAATLTVQRPRGQADAQHQAGGGRDDRRQVIGDEPVAAARRERVDLARAPRTAPAQLARPQLR